jgi:hypothetical protein
MVLSDAQNRHRAASLTQLARSAGVVALAHSPGNIEASGVGTPAQN